MSLWCRVFTRCGSAISEVVRGLEKTIIALVVVIEDDCLCAIRRRNIIGLDVGSFQNMMIE